MYLTAEQFADVIHSAEAAAADAGPGADKRRAPRTTHYCRVPIILGDDPQSGPMSVATVRDFSARGMCLLYPSPIPQGSQFIIRLDRASGPPAHLLAAVAHCKPQSKSQFVIGAEFVCLLDGGSSPFDLTRSAGHDARDARDARDVDRIRQFVLD